MKVALDSLVLSTGWRMEDKGWSFRCGGLEEGFLGFGGWCVREVEEAE